MEIESNGSLGNLALANLDLDHKVFRYKPRTNSFDNHGKPCDRDRDC